MPVWTWSPAEWGADLDCGDVTGGDIDSGPDASGGNPDLAAATRALRDVRLTDVVEVDGDHSSVLRDGRRVFIGSWSKSVSGGWLLFHYTACLETGVGFQPFGLRPDAMAAVVVDGGVRVRSLPTVDSTSIKYEPLLARGDEVFVIDGPVQADGYDWYLVKSFPEGSPDGSFGWVAAGGRDGEIWIEDWAPSECPALPRDAPQLGVILDELLVHCFGGSELSFELDSSISCRASELSPIEPVWMSVDCSSLSGDACGWCGLPLAADPQYGTLPVGESALWAFRGHFDDPVAATCRLVAPESSSDPSPEAVIHRCRTMFVVTSLTRLGPGSGSG